MKSSDVFGLHLILAVCFAGPALLFSASGEIHAQAGDIIDPSRAAELVNREYIPSAAEALERRGSLQFSALWKDALSGQPVVQYQLTKVNAGAFAIVPRDIIVPVEKDGALVGLIGIEPFSGDFRWRLDHVSSAAEFLDPPGPDELSILVEQSGRNPASYDLQQIRLVYTASRSYWQISGRSGSTADSLFILVDGSGLQPIEDLELETENAGFVVSESPLPATPARELVPVSGRTPAESSLEPTSVSSQVTWMVDDVPYYRQDCNLWCWAASLTMLHQWWSPESLGTSLTQQREIVRYVKGSAVCAGATADDIHNVVQNWHNINPDYENFQTTYKGEGRAFAVGDPTGNTNDPKTWLDYVESPVIAFVDTGTDDKANHAVLIVGYDDADSGGIVYVHDPWYSNWWAGHAGEPCYEIALSYALFNDKWDSEYDGLLMGKRDVMGKRHGMVAGIPGDNTLVEVGDASIQLSGTIEDDEQEEIFDIGVGPVDDSSAADYDSFGQPYGDGMGFELANPAHGVTSDPVTAGDFSSYGPAPPSDHIFFATHSIPQNGKDDGASFYVDPLVTGTVVFEVAWWVYDEDDRLHESSTVSVLDDRGSGDSPFNMYKPSLARDTLGPYLDSFSVIDDDTSGPSSSNSSSDGDILDSNPDSYTIEVDWEDPSGISEVEFSYRFGSGSWSAWEPATSSSGVTYQYDISRSTWIDHVGETIAWQSRAWDNDQDIDNDRSSNTMPDQPGGEILDDDTSGPAFTNHEDSGDTAPGTYLFRVRLDDPSGILDDDSYPRIYYRWNSDTLDPSHYDGYLDADWDGLWYTASMDVGADRCDDTVIWRSLAYDDDSDWSDDRSDTLSSVYGGGSIECLALEAPTNLGDTAVSQTWIDLSWQDNSSDESSFDIERSPDGTTVWDEVGSVDANVTSYSDTGLDCGTTYYYRARAYRDSDGRYSEYSNVDTTTTEACDIFVDRRSHFVDDDNLDESQGNGNGLVECAETIELTITLFNYGLDTATGVTSTLSSTDTHVSFPYNIWSSYPDIPGQETRSSNGDFEVRVAPDTPDGHEIPFDLEIGAANGGPWTDTFSITVTCLANSPPYTPTQPIPADGAMDQDVNVDLSWSGGDPDGDVVTYTVALEEGPCPPTVLACEDLTSLACDPGALDPSTRYCWQVMVTDEHSATITGPTWQFTTTAPICTEGIANGGFESTSAWEIPITAYSAAYSTAQAHSGARSMRVGIVSAAANRYSYSSARQTVTIPAGTGSATLGFWLYALSGEASSRALEIPEEPLAPTVEEATLADDQQYLLILNQNGDWIDTLLWQKRNDATWIYYEYDLSAYRGRTVQLQFGAYNDGIGGVTGMYVDDVSLEICPAEPGSSPPNTPAAPSPGNRAVDQPVNLMLTWTGGDPDGDAVTYDVYLAGSLLCEDVATESCTPPTLVYDESYEWYVVATDEHGASTTGPHWSFQTVLGPSYKDWYLAEGYTGGGFETFIPIQNSTALTATVEVTYMLEGGGTITKSLTVDPTSRYTIRANDAGQVGPDQAFSTWVSADQPIMVERAMYWPNGPETKGGHGAVGITEPSTTWYFAEGYTGASFQTFLLLQNPNAAPAVVDVHYMLDGGQVVSRTHTVPAESRLTVLANEAAEVGPDRAFSTKLVADRPIIAERAIYFANEGHDAAGVVAPATTWYLAEGYTGSGTETYILVQNPNASEATVEVTYILQGGGTITRTHVISATSRHTIEAHDAAEVGPGEAFSAKLVSDQPIIVERAMYWPDGSGGLAGHDTMGVVVPAEAWNLAEGYTGDGFRTFILIQNPNASDATVEVTYMLQSGGTIVKTHAIPPESRHTIETHDPGEVGPDQAFATRLVSDLPIVVERAMYFNTGGHVSCAVPQ